MEITLEPRPRWHGQEASGIAYIARGLSAESKSVGSEIWLTDSVLV